MTGESVAVIASTKIVGNLDNFSAGVFSLKFGDLVDADTVVNMGNTQQGRSCSPHNKT